MRSGCRRSSPRRWPTWATTSADYTDIDPIFGSLADFDALLARAHELGLKVIVDQVLSHSSDRAPVLQGEPAEPRQPQGRLVRLGRPQARRLAAQQLALDLRRRRLGLGAAPAPVLSAQLPGRAARLQLPQSRGAGLAALDHALLAGARRRRLPPRHRQLLLPRQAAARRPGRLPREGRSRSGTPTACSTTSSRRTSRRT